MLRISVGSEYTHFRKNVFIFFRSGLKEDVKSHSYE